MKPHYAYLVILALLVAGAMLMSAPRAEPEPCALPERMPAEIELHDGLSATEANYKQWLSAEILGAPNRE